MDILFLGTSAAVPSRDHATSAVAVRDGSDIALLDCGEGTQRQLMVSPFSFMKIGTILITHLHGDHVFGLPGLIQTMGLSERRNPLSVYGPKGLKAFIESTMAATEGEAGYPLEIVELEGGESFEIRGFAVRCYRTDHGIRSLGYVLRAPDRPGRLDHEKALALGLEGGSDMSRVKSGETVKGVRPEQVLGPPVPGMSVCYTGDTRPCGETVEACRGVDILIHEATYAESEARNAAEHYHSTALQAARIASDSRVGHLIMTHISHRYDDRSVLETEARTVFPESYAADDLALFEITRRMVRRTDFRRA